MMVEGRSVGRLVNWLVGFISASFVSFVLLFVAVAELSLLVELRDTIPLNENSMNINI
jgi:hypothetical protein